MKRIWLIRLNTNNPIIGTMLLVFLHKIPPLISPTKINTKKKYDGKDPPLGKILLAQANTVKVETTPRTSNNINLKISITFFI